MAEQEAPQVAPEVSQDSPPETSPTHTAAGDELVKHMKDFGARQAETQAKQRSITQSAREKVRALFAPKTAPAAAAAPETKQEAAPVVAAAATPAPQPTVDLAKVSEQVSAGFANKVAELAGRVEAAEKRAAEAEGRARALVEKAAQDPVGWVQENLGSVDRFQARLLNNGKPTEGEVLDTKLQNGLKAFEQRLQAAEQVIQNQARAQVLPGFEKALSADFPLVYAEHGAQKALDIAITAARAAGKEVSPQDVFGPLEAQLKAKAIAMAEKLGYAPAPTKKTEAPAAPKKTMTNATTSTTSAGATGPGNKRPVAFRTGQELKTAGRAMIAQLTQAGRLS